MVMNHIDAVIDGVLCKLFIIYQRCDADMMYERFSWCESNFGLYCSTWKYNIMTGEWAFKNEQQALLFTLKWS